MRLGKRPWLTVLLSIIVLVAYFGAQTIAYVVFLVVEISRQAKPDIGAWVQKAATDGNLLVAGTWAATIVTVPLILALARLQSLATIREYLGLFWPSARQLVWWVAATVVFVVAADNITWLRGREIVPQVMRDVYASMTWPVLLWLTLLVTAPLTEELLFRGFMFQGLVETPLKFIGATIITSLVWTIIHIQYDLDALVIIFIGGLLLGAARYFTGSLLLCMLMHAVQNLVATLELVLTTPHGQN
ncbi:MAG: CPBP family intramembrane glutamic endopeptidase [Pirellulales bacterium]